MWKHTRYMLRLMSHHSLWSKAAGLADTMALHSCVAVSLTHSFHMELWNLQNQTKLLAEQQLHDWDTARALHEFIIRDTRFASCMCESQWGNQTKGHTSAHLPPVPCEVNSTSIPRFPANAISSRQEMRPPSLMSCPALSRRSESRESLSLQIYTYGCLFSACWVDVNISIWSHVVIA